MVVQLCGDLLDGSEDDGINSTSVDVLAVNATYDHLS